MLGGKTQATPACTAISVQRVLPSWAEQTVDRLKVKSQVLSRLSRQGSLLMSAAGLGLECRVGVSAREREACQGVWCSAVQGGWAERAAVRASANLLVRCSVVSARWPQRSGLSYGPARCRRASRDYRAG